jgi:hypothetical protein
MQMRLLHFNLSDLDKKNASHLTGGWLLFQVKNQTPTVLLGIGA